MRPQPRHHPALPYRAAAATQSTQWSKPVGSLTIVEMAPRERWDLAECASRGAQGRGRATCRALLCAVALLTAACSEKHPDAPGEQLDKPDANDGGSTDAAMRSPRPDGGPILPGADTDVVLPFRGAEATYGIEVKANPAVLDVHLSIDTTGSISPEIDELQADLERKVVPMLAHRVPDVSFGVSEFGDFPLAKFGTDGSDGRPADQPYVLLTPITSDVAAVASAVARLDQPLQNGGDLPEAGAEALWQIATGKGYSHDSMQLIAPFDGRAARGGGTAGGVGFREGALRVVLHVTDAPSHEPSDYSGTFPGTHSMADAGKQLKAVHAKLLAIVAGACGKTTDKACEGREDEHRKARAELEQLALTTGALGADPVGGKCPNGVNGAKIASRNGKCPLVFDVNAKGEGLTDTLIDAIAELVDGIRFEAVTGRAADDPIGFVTGVEPLAPENADDDAPQIEDLLPKGHPDGVDDSFVHVRTSDALRFEVHLRNRSIAATDSDQTFRVVVQIEGDGVILEERTLRVIVPAVHALVPDASLDDDGGR
jgi:hypothetical protein